MSMANHCQTQRGVARGGERNKDDEGVGNRGDEPRMLWMTFLEKSEPRPCPVEECSGQADTRTAMRVQFWHRHVWYTVVILEMGNLSHPRCLLCDMLVTWRLPKGMHRHTAQCKKGWE